MVDLLGRGQGIGGWWWGGGVAVVWLQPPDVNANIYAQAETALKVSVPAKQQLGMLDRSDLCYFCFVVSASIEYTLSASPSGLAVQSFVPLKM